MARKREIVGPRFCFFYGKKNEPTSLTRSGNFHEKGKPMKKPIKVKYKSILPKHSVRARGLTSCNDKMIKYTKDMLKSKFDMKDMGLADVILGIKIIRTQNGLVLSQEHYVDKILNTRNAGDSGLARTPIDTSTRPDLAYAVSRLSRYPTVIEGYNDANWISNIKDSRSTSGYVFTLGGAAVSWKSSKQTVIAKSTMESEFIALDKCEEEAEWLPHSTMYNGKSRHIRRRHNSIRQLLSIGVISIDYVKSKDNIADPLTKGLSRELVSKSSKGMGLKPLKE
ncbi:NAC domain-containing protein 7-like protein [Tanacetum coccineum]